MTETASADKKLQFMIWSSSVSEEFWHRLAEIKLDALHLNDHPFQIQGFFAPSDGYLQLRRDSLPSKFSSDTVDFETGNQNQCPIPGTLYNTNTIEEFQNINKKALIKSESLKLWDDICSGRALEDPALLNRFFVISYADLKKWQFHYWFAFPALVLQPPVLYSELQIASNYFGGNQGQVEAILVACQSWRGSQASRRCPVFLIHMKDGIVQAKPVINWDDCHQEGGKVIVAFYDPCQYNNVPGWPLRNLLALAAFKWHIQRIEIFCYREKKGQPDLDQCLIGEVTIPDQANTPPEATGWEYNNQKQPPKLGPKKIDLASSMDPARLAEDAANLNLKLMRWRLLPSLDIDLMSSTKCLLLGAGTLGCQVARVLMAWGVRHITFVDCGRVAMSNPVRQSLFNFDDCGEPKSNAAAESLRRIFPGVKTTGVALTIPMPGHSVSESEVADVKKSCDHLAELVNNHDVIFLLTDTRESRWLPTLLCTNANKIAINAALGFDTYLVMRHGPGPQSDRTAEESEIGSENARLGCYFCNDVVAPEDSTANRTLDQQCTVTRPGVAPIASALAVELAVNLLHHPLRINAPADKANSSVQQPLGIMPHQIRGSVANFSHMVIVGSAFSKCTACSSHVIDEYRQSGFDFLLRVFNHPNYLEDLTGLTDLLSATKNVSIDWDEDHEELL